MVTVVGFFDIGQSHSRSVPLLGCGLTIDTCMCLSASDSDMLDLNYYI